MHKDLLLFYNKQIWQNLKWKLTPKNIGGKKKLSAQRNDAKWKLKIMIEINFYLEWTVSQHYIFVCFPL